MFRLDRIEDYKGDRSVKVVPAIYGVISYGVENLLRFARKQKYDEPTFILFISGVMTYLEIDRESDSKIWLHIKGLDEKGQKKTVLTLLNDTLLHHKSLILIEDETAVAYMGIPEILKAVSVLLAVQPRKGRTK